MHRIRRRPAGPHAQDRAQRRSRPPAGATPRERDRKALRSRQAGPPPPARLRSQPHLCAHSRTRFRAPHPRATPTYHAYVPRLPARPACHARAPRGRATPACRARAPHFCAKHTRHICVPHPTHPNPRGTSVRHTCVPDPRAHTCASQNRRGAPARPHPRAHTHAALTRATSRTPKPTRHTRAPHLCAPHPARPHPARLYLRIHASQARLAGTPHHRRKRPEGACLGPRRRPLAHTSARTAVGAPP